MRRAVAIGWLLGAVLLGPGITYGQSTGAQLDAIRSAYQQLDYATAEARAQAALANFAAFTPEQLVEIYTLLGVIAFSDNRTTEAQASFASALSLDPNLTLDPLLYSPKIIDYFNEVKATQAAQQASADVGAVRYVTVYDVRAGAALRSLVLPGWGQQFKGQRTKGRVLMGAFAGLAAGTVWAHLERSQAEDAYLAAGVADVADRYDTFDRWHKTRNNLALAAALIWGYSYFDALILRPAPTQALAIQPVPDPKTPGLAIRWRF